MNYLIVEDSPAMRRVIMRAISILGDHNTLEANDGVEAIDILNNYDIDFVITDWLMPNMDGIELVNKIRNGKSKPNIPILMITTKSTKDDLIHAFQNKVDDYVVKPINTEIIHKKIKSIMDKKKAMSV
ncbi:MAG: response regulator [Candidatus Kapabacteria bacterium]|nr:response regulator [Candidatus Kapabacteria bacterium]